MFAGMIQAKYEISKPGNTRPSLCIVGQSWSDASRYDFEYGVA